MKHARSGPYVAVAVVGLLLAGAGALWLARRPAPRPASLPTQSVEWEAPLRARIQAAPNDPGPPVELAQRLLAERRANDALEAARAARTRFPDSLVVQEILAEALAATGRTPEAVSTLRAVSQAGPGVRITLARLLVEDGRLEEAAREVRGLSALLPEDALRAAAVSVDALVPEEGARLLRGVAASGTHDHGLRERLADALLRAGKYKEAAAALQPEADAGTLSPTAHALLGSALRLSGDGARLPEAEQHLAAATAATPDAAGPLYELALARVQLRQWETALPTLERVVELAPELAEARRDLARLYARNGDKVGAAREHAQYLRLMDEAPAAVKELEPVVKAHPHDIRLALVLSQALFDMGEHGRVTALLKQLQVQDPRNRDVFWSRYEALRALGKSKESLEVLDALAALPDAEAEQAEVLKARADTLSQLQRYAEAEPLYVQLRDREPEKPERHLELGLFLANWSQRPDRNQAAEAAYRKALELRPLYVGPLFRLGVLQEAQGKPAEAIVFLKQALDLAPTFTDALRLLGRTYAETGERKLAAETLELYRRYHSREEEQKRLETPGRVRRATRENRAALARFYLRNGQVEPAIREWERVEFRSPRDPEAAGWLARLYSRAGRWQRQLEERTPGRAG